MNTPQILELKAETDPLPFKGFIQYVSIHILIGE